MLLPAAPQGVEGDKLNRQTDCDGCDVSAGDPQRFEPKAQDEEDAGEADEPGQQPPQNTPRGRRALVAVGEDSEHGSKDREGREQTAEAWA